MKTSHFIFFICCFAFPIHYLCAQTQYAQVTVDWLRVRSKPDTKKSRVLVKLMEGSYWKLTGEKTDFTNKIKLRGKEWDEPWYKIKFKNCRSSIETGWIYGGAMKVLNSKPKYANIPAVRLPSEYVKEVIPAKTLKKLLQIKVDLDKCTTAKDLIQVYQSYSFNDLTQMVNDAIEDNSVAEDAEQEEESRLFYWNEFNKCNTPYLNLNIVDYIDDPEGAGAWFNFDYWIDKAQHTPSKIDESLFNMILLDRYFFGENTPNPHFMECSDCKFDIMGSGKFIEFYEWLDIFYQGKGDACSCPEFIAFANKLEQLVFEDIISHQGFFEYSKEKVLGELELLEAYVDKFSLGTTASTKLKVYVKACKEEKEIYKFGCDMDYRCVEEFIEMR